MHTDPIFFTSDIHFGHDNCRKWYPQFRPQNTVKEMDEAIIESWNNTVPKDGVVFFLGDFSLKYGFALDYIPRLNGQILWIPGNHDVFHPRFCHKSKYENRKSRLKQTSNNLYLYDPSWILDDVCEDFNFLLCHFPWYTGFDGDKHAEYRPRREENKGLFLLHGHTHALPENRLTEDSLSVAWDSWGKVVSLEEILKEIRK